MSNLEKEQVAGQENLAEKVEAPLATPEKRSFLEVAKEKMASIGQKAESLVESGVSKFNQVKESVKFNSQRFIEQARGLDISAELSGIHERAKKLAGDANAKIQALVGGKKEKAPIEVAQEQQSELVQEEVVPAKKFFEDGEEFSPEQVLKEIRRLPRGERSVKLDEFKEKITYQSRGLAQLQEIAVNFIMQNPDINLEDLRGAIEKAGAHIGISGEQKEQMKSLADAYAEKHKKIEEVFEQHNESGDLFKSLFGFEPNGDIEIIKRPASIHIKIKNLDDYAFVRMDKHMGASGASSNAIEQIKQQNKGGMVRRVLIPGLERSVTIENSSLVVDPQDSQSVQDHEEKHVIDTFFNQKTFERDVDSAVKKARENQTQEAWDRTLNRLVDNDREYWERFSKDEIIAYSHDGISPEVIKMILNTHRDEGGGYDIVSVQEDVFKEKMRNGEITGIAVPAAEKALERSRREYLKHVDEGIEAFSLLSQKFGMKEAGNILMREPLIKWKRTALRLTEKEQVGPNFTAGQSSVN